MRFAWDATKSHIRVEKHKVGRSKCQECACVGRPFLSLDLNASSVSFWRCRNAKVESFSVHKQHGNKLVFPLNPNTRSYLQSIRLFFLPALLRLLFQPGETGWRGRQAERHANFYSILVSNRWPPSPFFLHIGTEGRGEREREGERGKERKRERSS